MAAMKRIQQLIDELYSGIRVYEGKGDGYSCEILECGPEYCRTLVKGKGHFDTNVFAVRHLLYSPPPSFDIRRLVADGVKLPDDFVYFYDRVGSAQFWWKMHYNLCIPRSSLFDDKFAMMEESRLRPPFFLLRFCCLVSPCYYALRSKDNGSLWDVVFVNREVTDAEVIETEEKIYDSFTSWLEQMVAEDGCPPGSAGFYVSVDRRLPESEVVERFGTIDKLLPPPKMKSYPKFGGRIIERGVDLFGKK